MTLKKRSVGILSIYSVVREDDDLGSLRYQIALPIIPECVSARTPAFGSLGIRLVI